VPRKLITNKVVETNPSTIDAPSRYDEGGDASSGCSVIDSSDHRLHVLQECSNSAPRRVAWRLGPIPRPLRKQPIGMDWFASKACTVNASAGGRGYSEVPDVRENGQQETCYAAVLNGCA
jgi:hypothetical protein